MQGQSGFMINRHLLVLLGALALGACSAAISPAPVAAQQSQRPERAERPERPRLRSVGEPGRVAAADRSLARLAREEGQWTGMLATLAPGALIHQAGGAVDAAQWLTGRANPAAPDQWAPATIWTSCDGTLAATQGRLVQPDGMVGTYVTVWSLQPDRSYKWAYTLAGLDNPQPVARARPAPPAVAPVDLIEVVDIPSVRGFVADCPRRGAAIPPRPPFPGAPDHPAGRGASQDGTLVWNWGQHDDGLRYVSVSYLRDGAWQDVVDFSVPPATAGNR